MVRVARDPEAAMHTTRERIEAILRETFRPEHLVVRDDSARHAGHAGAAAGGGHFEVEIAAAAFAGRSLVDQHRLVYSALAPLIGGAVHALALRTRPASGAGGGQAITRPGTDRLDPLLRRGDPVLLDGATGTELARRGVPTSLPLWSAHAFTTPDRIRVLAGVHADYVRAGAEIIVTNTFRTTRRALDPAGAGDRWREYNRLAVQVAREAVAGTACLVAGGLAPLEDCYRPDLVPPQPDCLDEHRRQAELLLELGVDLLFIETMNTAREARAALRAARQAGAPALLSLCPGSFDRLLSGELLSEVLPEILAEGGAALRGALLNCAQPETLERGFAPFAALLGGLPAGLYAHLGAPDEITGWRLPEAHEPRRYADWMAGRLGEGARLVGGCCGTTPDHIAALRATLRRTAADR